MGNSQRAIEAQARQLQALELRKAGIGYNAIAAQLGYSSRSGAHKAVMTALRKTLQEPADEVRKLELERLDALLAELWKKKEKLLYIDRILRLMERKAKLLGLDAPQRTEARNIDLDKLTNEQLEKLANGEDIYAILTNQSKG